MRSLSRLPCSHFEEIVEPNFSDPFLWRQGFSSVILQRSPIQLPTKKLSGFKILQDLGIPFQCQVPLVLVLEEQMMSTLRGCWETAFICPTHVSTGWIRTDANSFTMPVIWLDHSSYVRFEFSYTRQDSSIHAWWESTHIWYTFDLILAFRHHLQLQYALDL